MKNKAKTTPKAFIKEIKNASREQGRDMLALYLALTISLLILAIIITTDLITGHLHVLIEGAVVALAVAFPLGIVRLIKMKKDELMFNETSEEDKKEQENPISYLFSFSGKLHLRDRKGKRVINLNQASINFNSESQVLDIFDLAGLRTQITGEVAEDIYREIEARDLL